MADTTVARSPAPSVDRTPAAVGAARHVVIVGAGFGGLACAREFAGSGIRVTVIDRRNHLLFQPLLYQVATAALSPADIASPVRSILSHALNIDVVMGEVRAIDHAVRRVLLADGGHIPFDTLVLATGFAYNYFGHDEWARHAPGLKSIRDARRLRARLLRSFVEAESCVVPGRRTALLTTVIVGVRPAWRWPARWPSSRASRCAAISGGSTCMRPGSSWSRRGRGCWRRFHRKRRTMPPPACPDGEGPLRRITTARERLDAD